MRSMSVLGGMKAHRNGSAFEGLIDGACKRYEMEGAAFIQKTPEPMKPIKPLKAGQFVACYTKTAQPDYSGTLRGGRAVVFEAKHSANDRIEQKRVTLEQTIALNQHQALGAVCFVLVSFSFERFYRVPWEVWRSMREHFGKVSANEKDLAPYRINITRFLDGLEVKA